MLKGAQNEKFRTYTYSLTPKKLPITVLRGISFKYFRKLQKKDLLFLSVTWQHLWAIFKGTAFSADFNHCRCCGFDLRINSSLVQGRVHSPGRASSGD